jgi:O-succinylbenzoic acid--CoA ligase
MSEPLSVFDAAREAPGRPAVSDGETRLTYAELAERVRARIDELGSGLDPRVPLPVAGDVALATAITLYALLELRVPALLLHPRLTAVEREALLRSAAKSGPLPGEDPAVVLHTSGTTGFPRAAVLSRRALVASARASESNLGWRDDDRWLLSMPLAHVGGFSILTRCLAARRCVVLRPRFDPERLPQWVEDERVTIASLVPTMLARTLDANPAWMPPPWLRVVLIGGAGMPTRLMERATSARLPLVLSYGLTEACSQVTATPYESRFAPAAERSGIALPGIGLRVVDGRIEVCGPTMMSGYWNHTPLSPEEWFDTGDMGEIDDRGRLAVHARRTDLIVTGGENVYPAEVEAALESCPGIESAAVFGLPHDTWGQIVVAVLVADGEPPADEKLRAFLDARLAPHKRPRRIGYVKEMPHTRGGKLHRAALHVIANAMHDL